MSLNSDHLKTARPPLEDMHQIAAKGKTDGESVACDDTSNQGVFNTSFPFGGVLFELQGSINSAVYITQSELSVTLPNEGKVVLAPVNGELKPLGIPVSFSADGAISGSARFFVAGSNLEVEISAIISGQSYSPAIVDVLRIQ